MLDSAANLLIRWILRDGGKIETTKTQNDLLYNSSTQHLWSAPGKLPNTWRDFFSNIQRIYILRTNGLKYDMGCYIKIQIFNLKYIISSSYHQCELIDLFTCSTDFVHPNTHFHFIHIIKIDALYED